MDVREYEKPGIYEGLTVKQYNAIRAMRNSDLGHYRESPQHYAWALKNPRADTDALSLGTATHSLWLESETFGNYYCLEPDLETFGRNNPTIKDLKEDPDAVGSISSNPRGTKMYKAEIARVEGLGLTVLDQSAWTKVHLMSKSLAECKETFELRSRAKGFETTIVWERDGLLCKARLDMWDDFSITDLKTTNNVPSFAPREIQKWHLCQQASWYHGGAYTVGLFGKEPSTQGALEYNLAVVGNYGSHEAFKVTLDDICMTLGYQQVDWLWKQHLDCHSDQHWDSRYITTVTGSVTDFYYNAEMERMGLGEEDAP